MVGGGIVLDSSLDIVIRFQILIGDSASENATESQVDQIFLYICKEIAAMFLVQQFLDHYIDDIDTP